MAAKPKALVPASPVSQLAVEAAALAQVCDAIDGGLPITDAVKEYFTDTRLAVQDGVDEVLAFRAAVAAKAEHVREIKRQASERIRLLELLIAKTDERVLEVLEAFPDQPFKGTQQSIKPAKNPPSVDCAFELKEKAFRNVVPFEAVDLFAIPVEYLKAETVYCLNLKAIGDALKNGVEFPWAALKQGRRLNIKLNEGDK